MVGSVLQQKSYSFALNIVKVCKQYVVDHKEYVLGKQLLKSGTAIGALVREAEFAQSKADFISKLSIALKESNETIYWISLLRDSEYLEPVKASNLLADNEELSRMLISSIKTAKSNLQKSKQ
jgi:four helix bundle protein